MEGKAIKMIYVFLKFILKVCVLLVLLAFAFVLIIEVVFGYPQDAHEMDKELEKYQDEVRIVSEYMMSCEYESMCCYDVDYKYDDHPERYGCFYADGEYEKIEVPEVAEAVEKLFLKYRFKSVSKHGGVLEFSRWATLSQDGGMVYCESKERIYEEIDFLYVLDPLKEDNWYYYETDFERYKREHQ